MQSFQDFAAHRETGGTVLYVATGPSASEAHRFSADHAVAVACIGEAGLAIPGRQLEFVFFNNLLRATASRQLFDRTNHILCPEKFLDDDTQEYHVAAEAAWLPQDKLIVYGHREGKTRNWVERARRAVRSGVLLPFAFSPLCLLTLHLLGYRRILVFGSDGGHDHAPGMLGGTDLTYTYTPRARQVQKMAKVIEQESETRCFFWPDVPLDVTEHAA